MFSKDQHVKYARSELFPFAIGNDNVLELSNGLHRTLVWFSMVDISFEFD